jgi:ABC-type branched-subunit amino acid transport system substrate-binding protein
MKNRWKALGALAALTVAALTAAVPSGVASHQAKPKLPLVEIGSIMSLNTAILNEPDVASALQASVRAINRSGGLHGHPMGLFICNDQANPNQALSCAQQMIDKHVVAIVGGLSLYDGTYQPMLQQAGIPMIAINPLSATMYNAPNVYLPQTPNVLLYQVMGAYMAHQKWIPSTGAYSDAATGRLFNQLANAAFSQASGGTGFQPNVPVSPTQSDFAPVAAQANSGGALALHSVVSIGQSVPMIQAIEAAGTKIKYYVFAHGMTATDVSALGPLASKIVVASTYPVFTDPIMKPFVDAISAEAKRGDPFADMNKMSGRSVDAWLGVRALFIVTKGLKTIDNQTVTKALDSAKNLNLGPMVPLWTPSAQGPQGYSRASNTSAWFWRWNFVKTGPPTQVPLTPKPYTLNQYLAGKYTSK